MKLIPLLSISLALTLTAACSPRSVTPGSDAGRDADDGGYIEDASDSGDSGGDSAPDAHADSDVPETCHCLPGIHNDVIVVISDDSELWTYDPRSNEFEQITLARCFGGARPFSMAVDNHGVAWILYSDLEDIFTIDVNSPGRCEDPGYIPRREGFGIFGMSFANNSEADSCSRLFILSYSGSGAFTEGPDAGALGEIDLDEMAAARVASVDYDGGELAGTGDGRLFAFAGVDPSKLIEFDKDTGEVIDVLPLDGFSKTNASAFAFYGGDIYFFTEAPQEGCMDCLEATCAEELEECETDRVCTEHLSCLLESGAPTDECGGMLPTPLVDCFETCRDTCFTSPRNRVSQVTHLDWDNSDGAGRVLTVVYDYADIRVVGAGSSTCVAVAPY